MLFWKKRDEGFERHKYVRTTIKLRREARRQKAHQVGQQVAGGVKAAGAAADELARKGAARVGEGAKAASAAADEMARRGAARLGEGAKAAGVAADVLARRGAAQVGIGARAFAGNIGRMAVSGGAMAGLGLGAFARWLGPKLAPAADLIGRPGVGGPLTLVGLIAAVAGLTRVLLVVRGVDGEALAALGIGMLCTGLGLGPTLWHGHSVMPRSLAAPVTGLPSRPWMVAGAAALVALIGGIGLTLGHVPLKLPVTVTGSLAGLSLGGGESIKGRASVLTADRLRVGDVQVRLTGIEVPEPDQRCSRAGGRSSGRTWACGQDAKEALQRLVQGRAVNCDVGGKDAAGTAHGRCVAAGADIAEALVRSGHAFAEAGFVSPYRGAEDAAKAAKAGVWGSAEPERPQAWRDRIWAAAKRQAPEGCPIKGRVHRGTREYLLPWSSDYERVRISRRRGERWFCSEEEAVAAGWRSAERG